MKYESAFNTLDDILRNEDGCSTELDYIEQTSWLLFLKYPEKYHVYHALKFGDYNVGRDGATLTLPFYMAFLIR